MAAKTVAEALRIKPNTTVRTEPPDHLHRIGELPAGVTPAESMRQATTAIVFVDGETTARETLASLEADLDVPKILWIACREEFDRDLLERLMGDYRRRPVSRPVTIDATWSAMRFGKMKPGEAPVDPATVRAATAEPSDLPSNLGAPARRALAGAGIVTLADLTTWREQDVLALHGMGKKALTVLRQALAEAGLGFAES